VQTLQAIAKIAATKAAKAQASASLVGETREGFEGGPPPIPKGRTPLRVLN